MTALQGRRNDTVFGEFRPHPDRVSPDMGRGNLYRTVSHLGLYTQWTYWLTDLFPCQPTRLFHIPSSLLSDGLRSIILRSLVGTPSLYRTFPFPLTESTVY